MSKQSRKKAKHRRKHRKPLLSVICQRCGDVQDGSAGALLNRLADAMNSCAEAGIDLRVRHGALIGRKGYVLPLSNGMWAARTLNYDPFVQVPVLPDDLDD